MKKTLLTVALCVVGQVAASVVLELLDIRNGKNRAKDDK